VAGVKGGPCRSIWIPDEAAIAGTCFRVYLPLLLRGYETAADLQSLGYMAAIWEDSGIQGYKKM
jgi:hypothetical protein